MHCLALLGLVGLVSARIEDAVASCVDGKDNVVKLNDCEPAGGFAHFKSLVIQTYDKSGNPACGKNLKGVSMGQVHLPGQLKITSGTVTIATGTPTLTGSTLALTLGKDKSWVWGNLCAHGSSKNPLIPSAICGVDFCGAVGADTCTKLDQHGTISIADLGIATIDLPDLTGLLSILKAIINGDWKLGAEIKLSGGNFAACLIDQDIPFAS